VDFTEQYETMVEAWSTGQRRMWESWYSLLPTLTSAGGDVSADRSPHEKAAQVRTALAESSSGWSWLSSLAEGLSAGYSAMLRMLEVSTTAWTSMASDVVPAIGLIVIAYCM
jgi:hypothetical protein